ncbi:MAG: hypothetical protein KKB20_13910 [Proteobacteria bacterium]|nr:hypothetical protein [Pseudomonadota bacterium]
MPKKYHLDTEPIAARFVAPGRAALLDWEEGCLRCAVCVKQKCVYQVYRNRRIDPVSLNDTVDSLCKHCFQCVQSCPNRQITKTVNPEYERLGDDYWTPDILSRVYMQAETGRIPVSGAGYGGPFSGPGFDSIWTDMSEIVRPTRDGIHGREYISTSVDVGRKPRFVGFDDRGGLTGQRGCFLESPLPFMLGLPEGRRVSRELAASVMAAARTMDALAVVPHSFVETGPSDRDEWVAPAFGVGDPKPDPAACRRFRMIEVEDRDDLTEWLGAFKAANDRTVVGARLALSPGYLDRMGALAEAGIDVIHLQADHHARQPGSDAPGRPHLRDLVREAHLRLVELGLRDELTLLASGGLALAEHVAKAIVCGADAVVVDQALWTALECRACVNCLDLSACPVAIESVPLEWAEQRLINICGAWRNQLLEVLGAMGLREIRRLRGEVGRAMFFEQLEEESFGPIFGRRIG